MATADTRAQLLDAAEQLFADRGYQGTSIRAITELAGANVAAVGYHFGSKADLMTAVVRRVVDPITAAQRAALDRLLAKTADPPVAALVEAFAGPMFDSMPAGDADGARTSRLVVTILTDPADETRRWTGPAEAEILDRYLAALERALPGLSRGELWFRMRGILAVTAVDRVDLYQGEQAGAPAGTPDAARHWAMTFLTAAVSAPPTA